jgi:hypothetical protein
MTSLLSSPSCQVDRRVVLTLQLSNELKNNDWMLLKELRKLMWSRQHYVSYIVLMLKITSWSLGR